MTQRLRKLIKEFVFIESNRRRLTLGTSVRLNPDQSRLELVLQPATGLYPTDPDLFATTWLTTPARAKKWLMFEAIVRNKVDFHNQLVTAVQYRLSADGVSQLWWNGTAWVAPVAGQWNSEADISTNLSSFPIATRSLQIVVNLSTTDPNQTPEVFRLKVLYASDIEFQEEYVARSLIPAMRNEIHPITDYVISSAAGQTSAALTGVEETYDIVGVDSVFNSTTDPYQLNNIFSSYNPTTKLVTWTGSPSFGDKIWIKFSYTPKMILAQSQDFTELSKIPCILIESVDSGKETKINKAEWVIDRATNAGFRLADGFQVDLDITMKLTADKLKDLDRMADQAKAFFKDRLLTSVGQDEEFRLYTISEYTQALSETQSELHSARLRARICNAVFYPNDAKPVHGVKRFLMNGIVISEA
jgi:hypothetical protein